jgi:hypothetical protein
MTYIYKIATLNINGIAHCTRLRIMEEILWKHDIDIILLQEVTSTQIETIHWYTKFLNIGAEQRGTAILVKDGLTITHIKRLPSGRGIAGTYNGTWFVNLYAPSGAEKKHERETFYNTELPYLLPTTRTDLIIAGDFNCVLSQSDTTGQKNYSRAIDNIIRGYDLNGVWDTYGKKYLYALYTERGIPTRPNIRQPKPSTAKRGSRNSGSCVHQSLCNIASIVYRCPHTDSWKRKLEEEHSLTERRRLSTTSPDKLEEMANTHEILPHCRALVEALC